MTIHYFTIFLASLLNFVVGAVWFSKVFGKTWMKIHRVSSDTPKPSMKKMRSFMITELVLTFVINFFLYLAVVQSFSLKFAFATVFLLWLGFILPTITSSVIWGNDDKKYMVRKILISSTGRLVGLLLSAWIFFMWR